MRIFCDQLASGIQYGYGLLRFYGRKFFQSFTAFQVVEQGTNRNTGIYKNRRTTEYLRLAMGNAIQFSQVSPPNPPMWLFRHDTLDFIGNLSNWPRHYCIIGRFPIKSLPNRRFKRPIIADFQMIPALTNHKQPFADCITGHVFRYHHRGDCPH